MDIYKLKFTRLQNEIFRLLCIMTGKQINQRNIAEVLEVSPTAVSKALTDLEKENLISVVRDERMNLNLVELNRENPSVFGLKRVENLKMIYESGIVRYLEDNFPDAVIILFGSYSLGEDTFDSDIDIAVIGIKEKTIGTEKYDKILRKEIRIDFYEDFNQINKNLKGNIFNGIVLSGRIIL